MSSVRAVALFLMFIRSLYAGSDAESVAGEVREADDGGQKIVEIMRDAAGEFTHGLKLLALHGLLVDTGAGPVSTAVTIKLASFAAGKSVSRMRRFRDPLRAACTSTGPAAASPPLASPAILSRSSARRAPRRVTRAACRQAPPLALLRRPFRRKGAGKHRSPTGQPLSRW